MPGYLQSHLQLAILLHGCSQSRSDVTLETCSQTSISTTCTDSTGETPVRVNTNLCEAGAGSSTATTFLARCFIAFEKSGSDVASETCSQSEAHAGLNREATVKASESPTYVKPLGWWLARKLATGTDHTAFLFRHFKCLSCQRRCRSLWRRPSLTFQERE